MRGTKHLRYSLIIANKKAVSIAILASVFLTLLLSLHFHLWSDGWREGDLEDAIQKQEALIGTGIALEGEALAFVQVSSETHSKGLIHLWNEIYFYFCFLCMFGIFTIPAILFIIFFSKYLQRITLFSLSVRMNR